MHTYHRLQRVQRILRRILLVVDIGLRDNVVFLMTTHQVDVLLAIVVDGCLQAQLLVDGLVERLTEVGHFLDKLDKFLQLQTKEYGGRDGAYGYCRFLLVEQIGLAKIFTVT